MSRLAPLSAIFKYWVVFYLVTHGVSLPSDSEPDLSGLAMGLYYSILGRLSVARCRAPGRTSGPFATAGPPPTAPGTPTPSE